MLVPPSNGLGFYRRSGCQLAPGDSRRKPPEESTVGSKRVLGSHRFSYAARLISTLLDLAIGVGHKHDLPSVTPSLESLMRSGRISQREAFRNKRLDRARSS